MLCISSVLPLVCPYRCLPHETIVIAVGVRSNRELVESLAGSGLQIDTIGDVEPRTLLDAVREGFQAGNGV